MCFARVLSVLSYNLLRALCALIRLFVPLLVVSTMIWEKDANHKSMLHKEEKVIKFYRMLRNPLKYWCRRGDSNPHRRKALRILSP